ncbi:MAG: hypothetical protein V4533_09900 [Pseudomonadota bacterium]
MSDWFSEDERATIRTLADVLIPAAEGMPCASSIGCADAALDDVLTLRAELAPKMRAALQLAQGKAPKAALDDMRSADPENWQAFTLAIAAAYYFSPRVRALLGYSGPERRPVDPTEPLGCADVLAPVIARGPIGRLAP